MPLEYFDNSDISIIVYVNIAVFVISIVGNAVVDIVVVVVGDDIFAGVDIAVVDIAVDASASVHRCLWYTYNNCLFDPLKQPDNAELGFLRSNLIELYRYMLCC